MVKNIIFMTEFGFSKRDLDRYGFKVLKRRGLIPTVLDISLLTRSGYMPGHEEPNKNNIDSLITIQNRRELESYFSNLNVKDLVVCLVETRRENDFIFDILNKNSITYGFIFFGELPMFDVLNPLDEWGRALTAEDQNISLFNFCLALQKKITNSLIFINIKRLIKRITFRSEDSIFRPRYVVTSGLNYYKKAKISFVNRSCVFLRIHSLDYNIALGLQETDIVKDKYAVFLDDNQPYHPDNLIYDTGPNLALNKTPEDYYFELNRFFDFFERATDLKVLIAAHPRSNYSELSFKPFKERELHYGKTIQLIKDSNFVLGHHSTSLGSGAIFKKPILLLESTTLGSFNANYVHMQSRELGVRILNISMIDQIKGYDFHLPHHPNNCKKYIAKYIKHKDTEEINSWDFFVNSLDDLF